MCSWETRRLSCKRHQSAYCPPGRRLGRFTLFIGDFLFPVPSGSEPEPQRWALHIIYDTFLPEHDPESNRTWQRRIVHNFPNRAQLPAFPENFCAECFSCRTASKYYSNPGLLGGDMKTWRPGKGQTPSASSVILHF